MLLALGAVPAIVCSLVSSASERLGADAKRELRRDAAGKRFERTAARFERGRYLVEAATHCFGCHSEIDRTVRPERPLEGKKGGGRVLPPTERRPFALVFSNISPDRETGVGAWTDEELARAIREGVGRDGRTLHRAMPSKNFHAMSDEDLASVILYVRSIPAVRNRLPKMVLPSEVAARNKPLPPTGVVPPPDPSDPVKRGAYLVRISGCQGCHTPARSGEPIPGMEFAGGNVFTLNPGRTVASVKRIASANLTSDPSGIPHYDEAIFMKTMRTGAVAGVRELDVMPSYREITDPDLKDVFAFLRTQKPVLHRVSNQEPPTECPLCGQKHRLGDRNPAPPR